MLSPDFVETIRLVENIIGLRRNSFEYDSFDSSNILFSPYLHRRFVNR